MDATTSFRATIMFGWSVIVLLFLAGVAARDPGLQGIAVLTMALSYLTQWLVTYGMILEGRAYGPDVTSDDDGKFDELMRSSRLFARAAFAVQVIAAFVGLLGVLLLLGVL